MMTTFLASAAPFLARNDNIPDALIPIVAISLTFAWLIVKALVSPFVPVKDKDKNKGNGKGASSSSAPSPAEADAIREMTQTLARMESRVEALETILIERTRSHK